VLAISIIGTTKNTNFLEQVSRIFGKDDEILVVRLLNIYIMSSKQLLFLSIILSFSDREKKHMLSIFRAVRVAGDLSWQQLSSTLL
jgi:hypothetical protein